MTQEVMSMSSPSSRGKSGAKPSSRHGYGRPISKAQDIKSTLNMLYQYLKAHGKKLYFVLFIVSLTTLFSLAGPYIIGIIIDDYIVPRTLDGIIGPILLLGTIHITSSFTTWLQLVIMITISQNVIRKLRSDLFVKIHSLSPQYFDHHPKGDLMSRITNDVDNINSTLTQSVTQFLSSAITILGVLIMMFVLSWQLALINLLTIPLLSYIIRQIATRTRKHYKARQSALGSINATIEENITGKKINTAFGHEDDAILMFDAQNTTLRDTAIKAQIYSGTIHPMMGFFRNFNFGLIVLCGGLLAINDMVSIGVIAAFLNYVRLFNRPLAQIAQLYNSIQSALAGAERVFEVMKEDDEILDHKDAKSLDSIDGDVHFHDVSFSYIKNTPVIKNVSLYAKPGQTVALVGPTGAGKTTIVNLMTRFYDIDQGSICIDGHDIRDLKKEDLRRQLGIVLQDTYLFTDTVMENIRYGRLSASDDEVIAVAKLSNAHQFIIRLPYGYDTCLASGGDQLSHGQRQLLSIARAMLANPSILILDEATSNVDTRTEIHIQEALLNLMAGRTSFVIAHRLSTIRNADKILVMNHGEIIESGTHDALLDQNGFYSQMYEHKA